MAREGWEIATGRLILGIVTGAFYIAIAYGAKYALGTVQNSLAVSNVGVTVTSNVLSFMAGPFYFPLVVALVVVNIAHNAIKKPHTVKGPLKSVLGVLKMVFYYVILGGGTILFSLGLSSSYSGSLATSITLLVTLILLEVSAGLRVVQGGLEFIEARRGDFSPDGPSLSSERLPPPPPPV